MGTSTRTRKTKAAAKKVTEGRSRGSAAKADDARRRRPTQERSQRRLEAILEAAAEAFAEHGFSDTTMEGIAARADTSIGSLYQFFPNKTAVFREIAGRCMQLARQVYAQLLGPDPVGQPWSELLLRFIDGFRHLHETNVMMQAVWRNLELYGEYAEADEALLRELVQATAMLFAGWAPTLSDERRSIVATMVVNTVAAMMLVLARDPDPARGDALVEETKLMLVRYLSVYLGEPAATR